ncbi:MAG: hypothetical protein A2V88_16575 [Elusimicrobia bacterium RBG_16_66_12]|nr:MAG: hypothetical protein A2V88_16575 [Elusimicrobia bacterium RBG_16_66_12]
MNVTHKPMTVLADAWTRLEEVCRRLWEENSPVAVETQAIVEEFKGEVSRIDAQFSLADEHRRHEATEHEEAMALLRRQYEMELAGAKKRVELMEKTLHEKDLRVEDLLKALSRKEDENLEFHSQVLRMSAAGDEVKAKKMDEFYQELLKKEASMDASWQQRHKALENDHHQTQEVLASKQAELDAWSIRRQNEEESLLKRQTDLEIRSQHLVQEYRKKQQEIEDLKASLQKSISDLVRQYQTRLKGDASAH